MYDFFDDEVETAQLVLLELKDNNDLNNMFSFVRQMRAMHVLSVPQAQSMYFQYMPRVRDGVLQD